MPDPFPSRTSFLSSDQAVAQADERPRWNRGNFYGERFASFLSR
ncbi:MAG TPA: hypothetical protein VF121_04380 [Thermoanaerobaculia bacterium]|nr:hypothetical protein [Thermoanaerobaculia bacterium]